MTGSKKHKARGALGQAKTSQTRSTESSPISSDPRYTPLAPHHWYWGAIIATVGFFLLFKLPDWASPVYWGVIALGIWMMLDDAYQHHRQKILGMDYHTPWNRIYWGSLVSLERILERHPRLAFLLRFVRLLKKI